MARVSVLLLLLLCAVSSFVASQDTPATPTTALQQTPGVLERLMKTYVYPLREYDWAGAFRNLLDSVMTYVAPETKQPKSGLTLWDVVSILLVSLDNWIDSPSYRMIEEKARLLLGPLKGYAPDLNDFVTPQVAAHSYDYLGLLWLFTGLTIIGALVPLYKYIPEEELLYPEYEFEEVGQVAPAPAGMGDMMKAPGGTMMAPGDMMKAPGDMMKEGASSEKPPTEEGEEGGQQDYSYYDYQYGVGLPSIQGGQSYDYYDFQYGAGLPSIQAGQSYDDYDYGSAGKRRKINGYPSPHHLWQYNIGQQHPNDHAPSRR